jgi:hypothetical protein
MRKDEFSLCLPSSPFIDRVCHRHADCTFEPCHKRSIELEAIAALGFEETANVLGIAI